MNRYKVRMLKDYHPVGYEDEWVDNGNIVDAIDMPNGSIFLEAINVGIFNVDAVAGVDFVKVP